MMAARKRFVWRVAGLALSCIAGFSASGLEAVPDQTGLVRTDAGDVRGLINGDVRRYLGIPYAAPPVGALRLASRPSTRVQWATVLDATKFGGTCAQAQRGVFAAPSQNEDCLYLNIYAPRETNAAARNPVMVWFHGGGLFSGESNDYDGSKLVARGNVIVVTLNYRVGVFRIFLASCLERRGASLCKLRYHGSAVRAEMGARGTFRLLAATRTTSRFLVNRWRHQRDGEFGLAAFEGLVSEGHQRKRDQHPGRNARRVPQ